MKEPVEMLQGQEEQDLTDAALALMDRARATVANSGLDMKGDQNLTLRSVMALAVQALILSEMMDRRKPDRFATVDGDEAMSRYYGAAAGLGSCIGMLSQSPDLFHAVLGQTPIAFAEGIAKIQREVEAAARRRG